MRESYCSLACPWLRIYIRLTLFLGDFDTGESMLIDLTTRINNIAFNLRTVTAAQARSELDGNNGIVIDVRENEEVDSMSVSGAVVIPRGVLEMKVQALVKDAATPLYLFCASGMRAKLAAEQLLHMGYENVSVITCSVQTIKDATAQ
ncbi:hypothetical protein MTsDn1_25990 [Alteromonas sp. MTD1]